MANSGPNTNGSVSWNETSFCRRKRDQYKQNVRTKQALTNSSSFHPSSLCSFLLSHPFILVFTAIFHYVKAYTLVGQ